MPQITVQAFKWTGTGYNATYNTSHTAVISDNDNDYEGGNDSDETISIDGGAAQSSVSVPYAIDVSFTDTGGVEHVETFNFFHTDGSWYFVPEEGSDFTEGATLGSYQGHTTGWSYDSVACFTRGTLIRTPKGDVAIETLRPGDLITCADGTAQVLRQLQSRKLDAAHLAMFPRRKPIKIAQGALGPDLPSRDLWVSRQHRMVVQSEVVQAIVGQSQAMVPAIRLTELDGVAVDECARGVTYFHLTFDAHQIVIANGAPSESFYPGPEALKSLSAAARAEFLALFPDFPTASSPPEFACIVPPAKVQKRLVQRHCAANMPVLDGLR